MLKRLGRSSKRRMTCMQKRSPLSEDQSSIGSIVGSVPRLWSSNRSIGDCQQLINLVASVQFYAAQSELFCHYLSTIIRNEMYVRHFSTTMLGLMKIY